MKSKKEFGTVYAIILPNGTIYVGQTTLTIGERLWQHVLDAHNESRSNYNSRYCTDIRKYCNNSPIVIAPLEENVPKDQLRKVEREWILKLHANDPVIGYNFQDGRKVSDRNAYEARRRAANCDEINARRRLRRAANREECNRKQREYRAANRDEYNRYQREQYAAKKAT